MNTFELKSNDESKDTSQFGNVPNLDFFPELEKYSEVRDLLEEAEKNGVGVMDVFNYISHEKAEEIKEANAQRVEEIFNDMNGFIENLNKAEENFEIAEMFIIDHIKKRSEEIILEFKKELLSIMKVFNGKFKGVSMPFLNHSTMNLLSDFFDRLELRFKEPIKKWAAETICSEIDACYVGLGETIKNSIEKVRLSALDDFSEETNFAKYVINDDITISLKDGISSSSNKKLSSLVDEKINTIKNSNHVKGNNKLYNKIHHLHDSLLQMPEISEEDLFWVKACHMKNLPENKDAYYFLYIPKFDRAFLINNNYGLWTYGFYKKEWEENYSQRSLKFNGYSDEDEWKNLDLGADIDRYVAFLTGDKKKNVKRGLLKKYWNTLLDILDTKLPILNSSQSWEQSWVGGESITPQIMTTLLAEAQKKEDNSEEVKIDKANHEEVIIEETKVDEASPEKVIKENNPEELSAEEAKAEVNENSFEETPAEETNPSKSLLEEQTEEDLVESSSILENKGAENLSEDLEVRKVVEEFCIENDKYLLAEKKVLEEQELLLSQVPQDENQEYLFEEVAESLTIEILKNIFWSGSLRNVIQVVQAKKEEFTIPRQVIPSGNISEDIKKAQFQKEEQLRKLAYWNSVLMHILS